MYQFLTCGKQTTLTVLNGENAFESTREMAATLLGITPDQLPKTGALGISVNYGSGSTHPDNVMTTYTPPVDITGTKSIKMLFFEGAEKADSKFNQRYFGEIGFRKAGEDLGKGGTYVQLAGLGLSIAGFPEIGLPLIEVGGNINRVGEIAQIGADINEGKGKNATLRVLSIGASKAVGKGINLTPGTSEIQKIGGNLLGDQAIDKLKEQGLEKNEKEK